MSRNQEEIERKARNQRAHNRIVKIHDKNVDDANLSRFDDKDEYSDDELRRYGETELDGNKDRALSRDDERKYSIMRYQASICHY